MFRNTILCFIVYAVLNLVAFGTCEDPHVKQKLTELEQCCEDLFSPNPKDKLCHNVTDFENLRKAFRDDRKKVHKGSLYENKIYIKSLIAAIEDEKFEHVINNEGCINMTAASSCRNSAYQDVPALTMKQKLFEMAHAIHRTRSSCITSMELNSCLRNSVFTVCDNITKEYFTEIIEREDDECLKVVNSFSSNSTDSAESIFKPTISIFTVLITTLLTLF